MSDGVGAELNVEVTEAAAVRPVVLAHAPKPRISESNRKLLKLLLILALPVLAEHVLHMMVGINDTWLANHVVRLTPELSPTQRDAALSEMAAASAAVGTVSYVLWLIGLLSGAISAGSTAIIARATGARHRSLANSICGQSMSAAAIAGVALGLAMFVFARPIAVATGLTGQGYDFALMYFRMLSFAVPFLVVMFIANACLRGAGDTLTPAMTFVVVDLINIVFSWGLTYGSFGLPNWGFKGIAAGTVMAYCAGGVIQVFVLLRGRGGLRLYLHRLAPHWHNLKRILRIGIPGGAGDFIQWIVNFAMLVVVNQMDATLKSSAAHNNTVKIESLSYLTGFAFATAAATMVGQSLGMRDPNRATRSAYLSYALGGGSMVMFGVLFVTIGRFFAMFLSDDPAIIDLTTRCLFITGFCQIGFAAAMIFGGALRGAGDTLTVMIFNLSSIVGIRLFGVLFVAYYLKLGLAAMWFVLAVELIVRGSLIYGRFLNGGWKRVEV